MRVYVNHLKSQTNTRTSVRELGQSIRQSSNTIASSLRADQSLVHAEGSVAFNGSKNTNQKSVFSSLMNLLK